MTYFCRLSTCPWLKLCHSCICRSSNTLGGASLLARTTLTAKLDMPLAKFLLQIMIPNTVVRGHKKSDCISRYLGNPRALMLASDGDYIWAAVCCVPSWLNIMPVHKLASTVVSALPALPLPYIRQHTISRQNDRHEHKRKSREIYMPLTVCRVWLVTNRFYPYHGHEAVWRSSINWLLTFSEHFWI